jgi:5-(aminomethyl)-3-furanmethanol phosphate kinase
MEMWVVKLGGSLLNACDLQKILKQLADHGAGQLVIVPGGGVFAEQVRYLQKELCIDEITSHRMALRAMEQFGDILTSLDHRYHAASTIDAINGWLEKHEIPVWFPYDMIADNPAIRASWDITSDSLSLWLAHSMQCQNLVLIKATVPQNSDYSVQYLSQFGFLDPAFAGMMTDMLVRPWWLFHKQVESFFNMLGNSNYTDPDMKAITVTQ